MIISGKAKDRIKNNLALTISLFFTSLPALLVLLYLLTRLVLPEDSSLLEMIINLPITAVWLELCFWIGMLFLIIAIIYRRIKHEKGYHFLLVFLLFTVQAFFATRAKGAFLFVAVFVLLYKLLGFDRAKARA